LISAPGIYCLVTDVDMAAKLLRRPSSRSQASNVVLDFERPPDLGGAAGTAPGKYRDNLTSGVTTPFTGGHDAGGNISVPGPRSAIPATAITTPHRSAMTGGATSGGPWR